MPLAIREPAVAGRFYPGSPAKLTADIREYTKASGTEKLAAIGCVVPHAGYMYSGHVAGAVYERLDLPKRFVILCPNHTGEGEPLAIMSSGSWRTPLGDVPIDEELAGNLKSQFPLLHEDDAAHRSEHALEVQLPFLQVLDREFRFVPITVGTGHFEALSALGVAIANAIRAVNEQVLVVASSDMNHYESDEATRVKDRRAINPILELDPRGLYNAIREHDISMCGYGPTIAMLTAARKLGATGAELIRYATSGDVSGDRDMVVGYAGIAVF